jgi:hypothetical protein
MPRAQTVCSEPGCPELVERGACRKHDVRSSPRSSRNHRGVPRQARGHGAEYDRDARRFRGKPCELRLEGCTGVATGGDYTRPGDWTSPRRPACGHCQSAQGGRLAAGSR